MLLSPQHNHSYKGLLCGSPVAAWHFCPEWPEASLKEHCTAQDVSHRCVYAQRHRPLQNANDPQWHALIISVNMETKPSSKMEGVNSRPLTLHYPNDWPARRLPGRTHPFDGVRTAQGFY